MTEREFDFQRDVIRGLQDKAADLRDEARELDERAASWLVDLLGAANQEPWWGEAND